MDFVVGLTSEQLAMRRTGIGASEIAAIAGLDPKKTGIRVWMSKHPLDGIGGSPVDEMSEEAAWGLLHEPAIAYWYQRVHREVELEDPRQTLRHPEHRIALASPDRYVRRSGVRERLLQIKTSDAHEAWRWGEGPDDIPPAYLIQEQWEMFVTGLPIADLAVLIGGNRYREYTITADADLQANLLEIAERWWADYGCNPERHPPLDASPAAAEYLKRRFPQALAPMLDADAEAIELAHQLQVADAELKQVHARVELLENRLKEKIGDAEGLTGPDFRLTWRVVPRKGYEVKPSSSRQFRAKFLDVA